MIYGFTGAHRTGKTTLAQRLADTVGGVFVPTNVSGILKGLKVDPRVDLPFDERLVVQEIVLDTLADLYEKKSNANCGKSLFFDRTPIDVIGYTLVDVSRETVNDDRDKVLREHFEKAYRISNFYFSGLSLITPGILIQDAPGKAPSNYFYQKHVHSAIQECACDSRNTVPTLIVGRNNLEVQTRIDRVKSHLSTIINNSFSTINDNPNGIN